VRELSAHGMRIAKALKIDRASVYRILGKRRQRGRTVAWC
jgi:hypothetical protein